MTTTNIVLALISLISSLLSIYAFIRSYRVKSNEQANVREMKSLISYIYLGLKNAYENADHFSTIPNTRNVTTDELIEYIQVLLRQSFNLGEILKNSETQLSTWKSGQRLDTSKSIRIDSLNSNSR